MSTHSYQQGQGLSPGQFIEACNPSWSRVYNELTFNRHPGEDRLSWVSETVRNCYIALSGFNPAKVQYHDEELQHAALNSARELDCALFEADESYQLDGMDAVSLAQGWMAGRDWIGGSDGAEPPEDLSVEVAGKRFASASGAVSSRIFVMGFARRVKLGHGYVA